MKVWFTKRLIVLMLMLAAPVAATASFQLEDIEKLAPGEQYRQLSLLMLVSGGVDPAVVDMLQPMVNDHPEIMEPGRSNMALEDFSTPLARIVDQDVLLANAAQMFRYARDHSQEIQARMTQITQANPILISMVNVNQIAADAIIIRTAIADSIEYSQSIDAPDAADRLQAFRDQTVYLRNMMEYNEFQEELAEITNQAIIDLGGRLDAYQRMFDDDVDPDLIQRRVESAEIMNRQTGDRYEEQANMRNTELLMMLILMESQVR
jgi:hypothetical protein